MSSMAWVPALGMSEASSSTTRPVFAAMGSMVSRQRRYGLEINRVGLHGDDHVHEVLGLAPSPGVEGSEPVVTRPNPPSSRRDRDARAPFAQWVHDAR